MNSLIKRTALGGLLIGALPIVHAAPSMALGDDASLFVTGKVALENQSNIYRSIENEQADTVLVITPGIEMTMGGEGSSSAKLNLGYEIRQHFEEDVLNEEHIRASFGSLYDSGVVVLRTYAGYNEFGTNAQVFDGTITDNAGVAQRMDLTAGVNGKYKLTEQMAVGGGLDYLQRDWNDELGGRASNLTGTESLSIPVKLFFAVAPELDAFIGYRHRTVKAYDVPPAQAGRIPDYTDSYYFAGLEGQLFNPLWTVNLDVGFQDREYELSSNPSVDGTSNDGLTFSARVNYEADVNRSYYAILSRDYGQSTTRAISYERTRFTLGGDYRVTEMWSAFFGLTLADTEYDEDPAPSYPHLENPAREEHLVIGQVGVNYQPNEYLSVGASYQYMDRNVDNAWILRENPAGIGPVIANPGYSNHVWQVSASVRY